LQKTVALPSDSSPTKSLLAPHSDQVLGPLPWRAERRQNENPARISKGGVSGNPHCEHGWSGQNHCDFGAL